ncbi:hypothetical protein SCHIN_v1c04730 [Spiroplasma chinense]|uniref:Uncharacterized protein n=1 Tax=Spiroplasma chinense TaxID=216932 RepID=A0A5B9Y3Y7_9MOLU|nr:hypothetical protein [Spiroplasma chinense]QEH61670.1 hypothetical protein SCHIN_v1c04730 [Spiroplasma chinense]
MKKHTIVQIMLEVFFWISFLISSIYSIIYPEVLGGYWIILSWTVLILSILSLCFLPMLELREIKKIHNLEKEAEIYKKMRATRFYTVFIFFYWDKLLKKEFQERKESTEKGPIEILN